MVMAQSAGLLVLLERCLAAGVVSAGPGGEFWERLAAHSETKHSAFWERSGAG